jgi:hypothetical protein
MSLGLAIGVDKANSAFYSLVSLVLCNASCMNCLPQACSACHYMELQKVRRLACAYVGLRVKCKLSTAQ